MIVSFLTSTVTLLFIAAIHTVSISVTAPAYGNAMAVFTLKLIAVTLQITAILREKNSIAQRCTPSQKKSTASHVENKRRGTSSEPSAQS